MNDGLRVARRLENRSERFELAANFVRVGQIAVVCDRDGAVRVVDRDGLRVLQMIAAGR